MQRRIRACRDRHFATSIYSTFQNVEPLFVLNIECQFKKNAVKQLQKKKKKPSDA